MFKPTYINPGRRDLIKKLVTTGIISSTGVVSLSFLNSCSTPNSKNQLPLNASNKGDQGYEELRQNMLYKGNKAERYPDIIVKASTENEILSALEFAKENNMQIVCRTSGHNTAGAVLRNGGMLLDLSGFNNISLDVEGRTATVEPGATMGSFYGEISKHALGFPIADCLTVTFGGYLLGGGLGKNANNWTKGPACNAIISAEVILANGEKVTADEDQNSDILWSIRGCGPAFYGIISSYTLQLFDEVETVLQTSYDYSLDDLPEVLAFFDQYHDQKDDRVGTRISLFEDSDTPGNFGAKVSIDAFIPKGPENAIEEGKSLLAFYEEKGLVDKAISAVPPKEFKLPQLLMSTDRGMYTNTDNTFTDNSSALLAVVDLFKRKPPECHVMLGLTHGIQMYPSPDNACYAGKGPHMLSQHVNWYGDENTASARTWMKEFSDIAQPFSTGHFINQADNERFPERMRNCFTEESWNRLKGIRKKYDPDNRFFTYLGYT